MRQWISFVMLIFLSMSGYAQNRTSGDCSQIIIQNSGKITINCTVRSKEIDRLLLVVQQLKDENILTQSQLSSYVEILNKTVLPALAGLNNETKNHESRIMAIEARINAAIANRESAIQILGIPANNREDMIEQAREIVFNIRSSEIQRHANSCLGGLINRANQEYFNIWCRDYLYGSQLLNLFKSIHDLNHGRSP